MGRRPDSPLAEGEGGTCFVVVRGVGGGWKERSWNATGSEMGYVWGWTATVVGRWYRWRKFWV